MFLLVELVLAVIAVGVWIGFGILPALAVALVGAIIALRMGRRSRA